MAGASPRPPDRRRAPPDLQGIWNFATLTPLERPRELADKEFLSDAEAKAYVQQTHSAQRSRSSRRRRRRRRRPRRERLLVRSRHGAGAIDGQDPFVASSPIRATADLPPLTDGGARRGRPGRPTRAIASGGRPGESIAAGTVPHVQCRSADSARALQQLHPDRPGARSRPHLQRDDSRSAHRPLGDRPHAPPAVCGSGRAIRAATGKATRWSSTRRTSRTR